MRRSIGPNFFIIGATKAATTSLSSLLNAHPEAAIVPGKEPHFFSCNYHLGWRQYLKLFSHCKGKIAIGDASTSYSRIRYHPLTIKRIWKHVPEANIIYMVRHPLERIESAYVEHACTRSSQAFDSINDIVRHLPMVVDSSRYWEVFNAYRTKFTETKIKVVWFEEYIADKTNVFQDICRFLGIDDSLKPDLGKEQINGRENSASRMANLGRSDFQLNAVWEEQTRRWVIDQIRDDNCNLLAHFGRSKDFWGKLF